MRPPDKPAETECNGSSRIGSVFDEIAYRIFGRGGGHLGRFDSVPCGVDGLAIQVLNAALGLLQLAFGLCPGVAGNTSESFSTFPLSFLAVPLNRFSSIGMLPISRLILDLVLAFARPRAYRSAYRSALTQC